MGVQGSHEGEANKRSLALLEIRQSFIVVLHSSYRYFVNPCLSRVTMEWYQAEIGLFFAIFFFSRFYEFCKVARKAKGWAEIGNV